ncbi:alpha/beta hydrolase family protein [candidate division KSB1 bacterium]
MRILYIFIVFFVSFSLSVFSQNFPVATYPVFDQSNNIRNHLIRVADDLTHNSLAGINTLDDWNRARPQRYRELVEMLSLMDVPLEGKRPPLNVRITGTIRKEGYRIEKLYYESLPGLYVPANLYIPDNIKEPAPAILYVCGHAGTQKAYYQAHPRKFAQLGFVAIVIETIQLGEVRGEHHGEWSRGWFHWYSRGYTPGGVEAWNGIRALDLLCQRPEVDGERLGVTGNSGGGAQSFYIAAVDNRIKAAAPSCGAGTVEAQIRQKFIDGHCDCMMPINTYMQDFHDIGALFAPRPLLIAQSNRDAIYSIESARQVYHYIKNIYDLFGASGSVSLIEPKGRHGYRESSRTKIFSFFVKHLMGKDIPPDEIGDIDESEAAQLSVDELKAYIDGPPGDDRTKTIQETFVTLANPPKIKSEQELNDYKIKVLDFLQNNTFHAFPKKAIPLNIRLEFRSRDNSPFLNNIFSFVPERDWRLKLGMRWRNKYGYTSNTVLVLRNPEEKSRDWGRNLIPRLDKSWNIAYLETRGTGESGWSSDLQWHIRRSAAWTGRTVASMRVYDVLRCLKVLRSLQRMDDAKIMIAAQGEMAAVALYAALLDGNITTLILREPPATQNAPSSPDGRGEAIEMLNCLRITDLPQVAGLMYPAKIAVIGSMPESYNWAKDVYKKLGSGDDFINVKKASGLKIVW